MSGVTVMNSHSNCWGGEDHRYLQYEQHLNEHLMQPTDQPAAGQNNVLLLAGTCHFTSVSLVYGS